jgi:hypothetical protein
MLVRIGDSTIVRELVPREHERYDGFAHVFDAQFPKAGGVRKDVQPLAVDQGRAFSIPNALDLQFFQCSNISLDKGNVGL